MQQPGRLPLYADRWAPFSASLSFVGIDLTGATLQAQVRLEPDAPGDPLINMPVVTSASATGLRLLSVTAAADGTKTSFVSLFITEAGMEALPPANELGCDLTLAWDMQITPAGGVKQVVLAGPFIVRAGVTH